MKLLPRLIGDGAVRLAADVEAGASAIAKGARVFGQTIDAEAFEDHPGTFRIAAAEPEEVDIG